ncbi:MAG: response regulator [Campylobacterota bacterium]|nr:response regulator [Campylobacterota bacterium]
MSYNEKLNILFVDDSSVIRDMVESSLIELGYMHIQSADDGVEALALSSQDEYDFIITDINMPNMDGIELISRLRNSLDYMSTPIMVLTTEWSQEMKEKGREVGATSWIVKPFNTELLGKAIIETIERVEKDD